jgi:hypothetical protein
MTTDIAGLFAEGFESCRDRESKAFDLASEGTDGIVLFGAGSLGRKILATLRSAGQTPLAFADNNRSLWDKEIDGISVLSASAAGERYGRTAAFVVTI